MVSRAGAPMTGHKKNYLDPIMSTVMPDTYSRRMTRYCAYDADDITVRGNVVVDKDKVELEDQEDKENLFLESLLTKIHEIAPKFVLVNTAHADFPIVYVSDEFLKFWRYSRKQIFLKDGRLSMLAGDSTPESFCGTLEETMRTDVGQFHGQYTLYKEGHTKAIEAEVSVLTLPKHSKAKYVLIATEEMSCAETFGLDLTKKRGLVHNMINFTINEKLITEEDDPDRLPDLIKHADVIRRDFEKENTSAWVIIHDNAPKLLWDWAVLYSIIFTLFLVPIQYTFRINCTSSMGAIMGQCKDMESTAKGSLFEYEWIILLLCELLFIADVCLSCLTTYISDDGVVISDVKSISAHYLRTWFLVDFLAAIPWEIILLLSGAQDDSVIYMIKGLAILRVMRVVRNSGYYMSSGFSSLLFMMAAFLMFAHFLGCGWFILGKSSITKKDGWLYKFAEEAQNPSGKVGGFDPPFKSYAVGKYEYDVGLSISEVYLASLYFSFTSLSTVGFGNAAPQLHYERVYSIAIMLIGSLMYATIFGYVARIIQQISKQTSELNRRQTELVDFINVHRFPKSLSHRMEDFFYNQWFTTRGVVATEIMAKWPKALREDCFLYMHDLLLKQWPVLKEASIGCQRGLCSKLRRINQCPGDVIYHEGDVVGEIYFVIRGHIKVIKNGRLIGVLTSGDVFGEGFWPLRPGRKSKADVQAITYCEFEVLSHSNLNDIMIQFPDYWDIWTDKLKISYELSSKAGLFPEDTPEEIAKYVEERRTAAPDAIVEEIFSVVSDPKTYYKALARNEAKGGIDSNARGLLKKANAILKCVEGKFAKSE